MPTRRQFLLSCSALAAAASASPSIALGAPFRRGGMALDQISFRDFADMVNTAFQVSVDSRTVELRLVGAKPAAPSRSAVANSEDGGNEKFSLLFSGPVSEPLSQDTHNFEHQRTGRFQMFIVPVGPREPGHRYYEAVFNRPVPGRQPARSLAGRSIPPGAERNNLTDKSKTSRSV
jgi:hypothetical protein